MCFKNSGSLMKVHKETRKGYQWLLRGISIVHLSGMPNKEKLVQTY